MLFDGVKGGVADVVLDFAGILHRHGFGNAQSHQHPGQDGVALVDLFRNGPAGVRQVQAAVVFHPDQPAIAQQTHGPGNAGLGIPQIFAHVHRTDEGTFSRQHQDGLQVHLAGFVDIHGKTLRFLLC